ncbi:LTP_2 domain-containing protein [Cephalotus follicularis]|uniref:LTP_2 domain-containing protein n=1 Tax=Cephalotus follicularis TaxID=3775 RepID=A0A1Q3DBV9_CEPFO|nr:LTP_2 domain-containing protein [Cephalotus follicularis]
MELFVPFPLLVSALVMALVVLISPVHGQVGTSCTASQLTTFTPCLNFLSNSTANGTSPSAGCCNSLKSLTSGSMNCVCQILTGGVPFQIPINRTLAISLPRACNMSGVPLGCNATAAPVPAPAGSVSLGPTPSTSSPTPSTLAPESDTTPLLTPPVNSDAPAATTGSRSVNPTSAAMPSYSLSPSLLLTPLAFVLLKYY